MLKCLKKKKGLIYGTVAVLLGVVLSVYFVLTNNQNAIIQTRTVSFAEQEVDYQKYLSNFDDYTLTEESDTIVTFNGTMAYDGKVLEAFDKVSFADDINTEEAHIIYNCSFNSNTMQFIFFATLIDEDNNIIEFEQMTTDAIITENGGLDAKIEIDGVEYLMSDYMNVETLDNCLFGWLTALIVVVVVVIVYIVIAETSEQIRVKSNYKFNKQLEADGKGVAKNNYITNQTETNRKNYNCGAYRFGFTTFSGVGCEVAAMYNAMIALEKGEMLSETINCFEKWAIEFAVGWGNLGSNPNDIYRYLNKKEVSYIKYTSYDKLKSAVEGKENCKIIMSQWNDGSEWYWPWEGIHTYYIEKTFSSQFYSYNYHYRTTAIEGTSLDNSRGTGGFIVAYVIA